MSFLEFFSNFSYRQQLTNALERYQKIKPPANPSRRYIDKLVARLLDIKKAWNAHRELELIGLAAVPSLLNALNDPRFHQAKWKEFSPVSPPLDSTLDLLGRHCPIEVVTICSRLSKSPINEIRKTAALHLASAGRASTIPLLQAMMQDDDGDIRGCVSAGIRRAVTEERAENEFNEQAYNLLLSQGDQDGIPATNDVAETLILLDPIRAAIDLGNDRVLHSSNKNAHSIIEAFNRARILLPELLLRRLLEVALAKAIGESCYPHDYLAAAALNALARQNADQTAAIAESHLNHENARVREAAAEALATLANISELEHWVGDRVDSEGYAALSHPQRVVYCAFLFDAEVRNGGLMQFFGNNSGDCAAETLAALSELGHKEGHAALASAIKLIGPLACEPDRDLRLSAFEGRLTELQSAFDPFETAYYDAKVSLRQSYLLYAVRHRDHFQR